MEAGLFPGLASKGFLETLPGLNPPSWQIPDTGPHGEVAASPQKQEAVSAEEQSFYADFDRQVPRHVEGETTTVLALRFLGSNGSSLRRLLFLQPVSTSTAVMGDVKP
ncbi:MAG TPA: hypothetical protein VGV89_11080 [Thermoplasmata archaeon]|nr:hypothetical protein [Thermoplasmata archaeon]